MFTVQTCFAKEKAQTMSNSFQSTMTIQTLQEDILKLKEEVEEYAAKKGVAELFVHGKYTPQAKHGFAKLTTLGVAVEKVGPVIKAVLEIVGLTPNQVPCGSTAASASFYLKALINEQLREVLYNAAKRGEATTLASDESTKNGKKLEAFVLFTSDELDEARDYCLGMVDILDKSATTAIEKLKQIIEYLESEKGSNLWETFVMTVGNVMSDQARTQTKFNNLLEAIKKVIVENDEKWQHLNESEKKDLYKLRVFYCQLHILQNATPVILNALLEHEKSVRGNDELNEPSVVKLIKELARLIGERAASKYDVHQKWILWAKNNGVKFASVPDFSGHRFNIIFAIADAVQYLKDDLIKFAEDTEEDVDY